MNKRRKKVNRAQIRKRRKLRNQWERSESRLKKKYVPEKFLLGLFLREHIIEVSFMLVMIAGVLGIRLLGPDKKGIDEMSASVSSIIRDKSRRWEEEFPYGYKIIALSENNIIHTSYDTLSEDLEIDWNKLSIARIQASQTRNAEEKIRIVINGVKYLPVGGSGQSIRTVFTRKKGARLRLAQFGSYEFVVEIVEDDGNYLFCLFGLRANGS